MNDKSTSGRLNLIESFYGIIKCCHILGIRDPNLELKFGISDEKIYLVTTLKVIYTRCEKFNIPLFHLPIFFQCFLSCKLC